MTLSAEAKWSAQEIIRHLEFLAGHTQDELNFEEVPHGYIIADKLLREIRTRLGSISSEVKAATDAAMEAVGLPTNTTKVTPQWKRQA